MGQWYLLFCWNPLAIPVFMSETLLPPVHVNMPRVCLPNPKQPKAKRGFSVIPLEFSSCRGGGVVQARGFSDLRGAIHGVSKDLLLTENLDGSAWQCVCFLLVLRTVPTVCRDNCMGAASLPILHVETHLGMRCPASSVVPL